MSTYTDLHNKVKESIVVQYHPGYADDRVTHQNVKLLNEENEYWGTFKGTMKVEDTSIVGGTLDKVTITNATLSNISWPGGAKVDEAMASCDLMQKEIDSIRSVDLPIINQNIDDVRTAISQNDKYINERVGKVETSVLNINADFHEDLDEKAKDIMNSMKLSVDILDDKINTSVEDLIDRDNIISAYLNETFNNDLNSVSTILSTTLDNEKLERIQADDDELTARIEKDKELCAYIAVVDSTLKSEINRSIVKDDALELSIYNESLSSIQRDKDLSDALSIHNDENIRDFENLKTTLLSTIEHERHYIIEGDGGSIAAEYPYKLKDFAVNILEVTVKDNVVKYNQQIIGSVSYGKKIIDGVTVDAVTLTVSNFGRTPETSILNELFDDPYTYTYEFDKSYYTPHSYCNITYVSADKKFLIRPIAKKYCDLVYSGITTLNIGKLKDYNFTDRTKKIVSCLVDIEVPETDTNFREFVNKFNGKVLSLEQPIIYSSAKSERITLKTDEHDVSYLIFDKNITPVDYCKLATTEDGVTLEFGRIYDLPGKVVVEDGKVQSIAVNVLRNDAYLLQTDDIVLAKSNNFLNEITLGYMLSASVKEAGTIANVESIDICKIHEKYKYFAYLSSDTDFKGKSYGYIVPETVNEKFPDIRPNQIDVVLDKVIDNVPFEVLNRYTLTKVSGIDVWKYGKEGTYGSDWIVIEFNKNNNLLSIRGFKSYISYDTTLLVNTAVSIVDYDKSIYNIIKHQALANGIVYDTKSELYTRFSPVVAIPKESAVSKGFDFVIEADEGKQKLVIPAKDSNFLDNSRELLVVSKFKKATTDDTTALVNVEFVDENYNPIEFFNNRHKELITPANVWSTFKVQEVNLNKFLITDLDDNEDHWKFDELVKTVDNLSSKISAEVDALSNALSTEIDTLSSKLSAEVIDLSTSLSDTVVLSVEELQKQIISNDSDILFISSEVSSNDADIKFISAEVDVLSDAISAEVFSLSNQVSAISADHEERISQNESDISTIYETIKSGINYKGTVYPQIYDSADHLQTVEKLSNLFVWTSVDPTHKYTPLSDENFVLSTGFMFYVKKFDAEEAITQFNIEGIEIETGDYIIVNCHDVNGKAVKDITSTDIDVIDAIDNDVINFLSDEIDSLSTRLSNEIIALSDSISSTVVLSVGELQNQIISNDDDIIYLSSEISANDNDILFISSEVSANDNDILFISSEISANDNDISYLCADLSTVSSDLDVLEHHYYERTMSCDIDLTHAVEGSTISAVVDKLLIVDEVTFDLYALTIRNGALNINKVSALTSDYK